MGRDVLRAMFYSPDPDLDRSRLIYVLIFKDEKAAERHANQRTIQTEPLNIDRIRNVVVYASRKLEGARAKPLESVLQRLRGEAA